MVLRAERNIIKNPSAGLLDICHKAKNLFNYCNYIIRQKFFAAAGFKPREPRPIPSANDKD